VLQPYAARKGELVGTRVKTGDRDEVAENIVHPPDLLRLWDNAQALIEQFLVIAITVGETSSDGRQKRLVRDSDKPRRAELSESSSHRVSKREPALGQMPRKLDLISSLTQSSCGSAE
jgi:hypothetical protein